MKVLLTCLATAQLLSGCSDSMERAGAHAAVAVSNLEAGNLDDARSNIRSAIAERDDVADYYIILGRIELASGSLISTFNAYSMALDLQADNAEALANIAEIGLQIGRTNEAAEAADRILLLSPQSVSALLVKGFIEIDNGRLETAKKIAKEILEINPDDEGGTILSARIEAIKGNDTEALAIVNEAIAKQGATQALNITKLEILRLRADGSGMMALFPTIIADVKDPMNYRLDYINLLYKLGEIKKARAEAVKAINLTPNDQNLFVNLDNIWLEYDNSPLTSAQIDYMARNGTAVAKYQLAKSFLDLEKFEEAQRLIKNLVDAGNIEAQALSAKIELALGNEKEAYSMASQVLKVEPSNENALVVRSHQAVSRGNFDKAIRDASFAVSNAPQNQAAYVQLAGAYRASGSTIRARQIYENGLDALPQSLPLVAAYESFLEQAKAVDRIPTAYGDLAAAKPSSVRTWQVYAKACQRFPRSECASKAQRGLLRAQRSFMIDDVPGSPKRRGLFARITPEKICAITGGVCTDS